MTFLKFLQLASSNKKKPTVVVFAGGLGAQIINSAVYMAMKKAGEQVYADYSYFNTSEKVAEVGNSGEVSHWAWGLAPFGLAPASFEICPDSSKRNALILRDGLRMLELGLDALGKPDIQSIFKIPVGVPDVLPIKYKAGYLCMHVRRGDFVNVASHMIADDEFFNLAKKFSGIVQNAVILSDSPIKTRFRKVISSHFEDTSFLDNIDPHVAHRIMRKARILVCSNSTFSLTAAALNPDALIVIPKQWFGGADRQLEAAIHSRCSFQIMNNGNATAVSAGKP